ncbi:MAG: cytochrome c peroxidase [Chitinophagaceae bacterium]
MTLVWTIRILLSGVLGIIIVDACKKDDVAGTTEITITHPIRFTVPAGFPQPKYNFSNNPLTEEGFALGRKLFYDGRLSKDGNFPCGSCHQQFAGFANFEHNLSHGFNNQFTTRNAPGIFNMAWGTNFHWDGGINNLEVQPLAPITAPNEMAEDLSNIITKLKKDDEYKKMFKAAFGDNTINSQRMLWALTQFVVSITSANSRYDKMKRGEVSFNPDEQKGYEIFKVNCNACHTEPLFTDNSYRNNGLPVDPTLKDYGRMRITNNKADSLKFKVPTLRNINLTFPYGHDGRFIGISQVLDHYSNGIQASPTLDSLLKNKIPLTKNDKFYLYMFLRTLTDSTLLNDKRFSEQQ